MQIETMYWEVTNKKIQSPEWSSSSIPSVPMMQYLQIAANKGEVFSSTISKQIDFK